MKMHKFKKEKKKKINAYKNYCYYKRNIQK